MSAADCQHGPLATFPICDMSLSPMTRAMDLTLRLNISERIWQLGYSTNGHPRLGLPGYSFGTEGLHGVASGTQFTERGNFSSASYFPTPINTAATFDRALFHAIGSWISTEARAFSNAGRTGLHFWAPNINIVRDPRWGRSHETSGEDPYLTAAYALQYVSGMQWGVDGRYYKVVSTCKHWLAYDIETGDGSASSLDRHHFNAVISDLDIAETQLPAFESCVRDARAGGIMCSYNEVNGVPTCSFPLYEQTVLRDEWGFTGTVVSDCGAIEDISDNHHYAANPVQAVAQGLSGGTDMECQFGPIYYQIHGQEALNQALITEEQINLSVARAYQTLVQLGYFDDPRLQPYRQIGSEYWNTSAAQAVSLQAAKESIVLLKNEQHSLPIDVSQLRSIAVIGHAANESLLGPYIVRGPYDLSVLTGIQDYATSHGVNVSHAIGAWIAGNDTSQFKQAVALAQSADLVIYVGGVNQTVASEGRDQTSLELPGVQLQLIQALEAVSTRPLVTVIIGGVSTDVSYLRDSPKTGSLLWIGFPGMAAGPAVASVLFGEFSPAGRLPITIYPAQYAQDVRMDYMGMRPSSTPYSPGRTYKFYTGTPIYPFGFGMSYTTFAYTYPNNNSLAMQTRVLDIDSLISSFQRKSFHLSSLLDDVHYEINVTNTGGMPSDHSVLGFLSSQIDPVAQHIAASPPISQLFDFQHLHGLRPGEWRDVVFTLQYRSLSHYDSDGNSWLLPGNFFINIGRSDHADSLGQTGSAASLSLSLRLTGKPTLLHRHTLFKSRVVRD